ncbi:MAG: glucosaminidase domain-containing protein [Candidatus Doudnabacteria bacterium]|nr:glucosaminidase domain-containing protein [Candidatus Doudnabacteria bacterium]
MNVEYLIQLLQNRLQALLLAKDQAFNAGDLERINTLDAEVMGVQDTLSKLNLLQTAAQAAAATNSTLVEAMTIQPVVVSNGSTDCLNNYDISTYASDPLHEQKIADILHYIGSMDTQEAINAYIDSEAISSPLTGEMFLNSAQKYSVDVRLMMAIIELDSRFGTAGVAVNTFNPGNVGNTGSSTRTYSSWAEGVNAVADWLNKHRINSAQKEPVPAPVPTVENSAATQSSSTPETLPETTASPTENASSTPAENITNEPAASSTPPTIENPTSASSTPESVDPGTSSSTPEVLSLKTRSKLKNKNGNASRMG